MDPRYDTRDAEERAAVAAIVSTLLPEHAAHSAFAAGLDTNALTHLVADQPDLVEHLKDVWLAGYRRMLDRAGAHFRP